MAGNNKNLSLGIDLGTTSVKICVINAVTHQVVFEITRKSNADVPVTKTIANVESSTVYSEQDVCQIFNVLGELIDEVAEDLAANVVSVGVTGQQHGIVLWNSEICRQFHLETKLSEKYPISRLITWQDQRCTDQFLKSLPPPEPNQVLATGYGVCTLLWLLRYDPDWIKGYDMAGTIMDFVVWMLSDIIKPIMSPQNADAWGYYNPQTNTWNTETLAKCGVPVSLLPDLIEKDKFFVGKLRSPWKGIKQDVAVSVGMGDLQCSFAASLENENDAILNFSTSSQLTFIRNKFTSNLNIPSSCDIRSYFDGQHLVCAPSLNGGNVLEFYAETLHSWVKELQAEVKKEDIWKMFIEKANASDWKTTEKFDPVVNPRIFGERYQTGTFGSVSQINVGNCKIDAMVRGILRGVIGNLAEMIPPRLVQQSGIKRIMLTGSLFTTFPQLKEYVGRIYQLPVAEKANGKDAAFGAAFFTTKFLHKTRMNSFLQK